MFRLNYTDVIMHLIEPKFKSIFGEHFKTLFNLMVSLKLVQRFFSLKYLICNILFLELDSTVSMEKDSVFKKLKPSKHRYSIRPRDEL